jgi:hypothetical protein
MLTPASSTVDGLGAGRARAAVEKNRRKPTKNLQGWWTTLATPTEREDAAMRRVPFTGDEKESLQVALDRHRDAVLWKLEGLGDDDLRRAMTPSGTNLLGLVKHLAANEYGWFCGTFGREHEPLPFDDDDPEADLRIEPHETTADVLAFYGRARAASDQVTADLDLEDTGTAWFGEPVTLRWVLVHMVEETARHAGHADIVRELIDGATGDHAETEEP